MHYESSFWYTDLNCKNEHPNDLWVSTFFDIVKD